MKKRFLSLFLLLILTLSTAGCASGQTVWAETALARPDPATDGEMDLNGLCVAISVNAPFGGMELDCKTESQDNSVTISVYKANLNYETSLSGTPVRTCTVRNVGTNFLWKFRTLPAGDYLIVFSDVNGVKAARSVVPSDAANGKILQYRNGSVVTEGTCRMTLLLTEQKEETFSYLGLFAYPVPESDES